MKHKYTVSKKCSLFPVPPDLGAGGIYSYHYDLKGSIDLEGVKGW
jgi:hypothetical protein